jgi:hypothetical protein
MDIILMVDAHVVLSIVIGIQIFGVIADAARQNMPGGSSLASVNRYFVKQPGAGPFEYTQLSYSINDHDHR